VKRKRALLGSNPPRNSRFGDSLRWIGSRSELAGSRQSAVAEPPLLRAIGVDLPIPKKPHLATARRWPAWRVASPLNGIQEKRRGDNQPLIRIAASGRGSTVAWCAPLRRQTWRLEHGDVTVGARPELDRARFEPPFAEEVGASVKAKEVSREPPAFTRQAAEPENPLSPPQESCWSSASSGLPPKRAPSAIPIAAMVITVMVVTVMIPAVMVIAAMIVAVHQHRASTISAAQFQECRCWDGF
jgi:hypothetical protein